jgi:hypothetical protein
MFLRTANKTVLLRIHSQAQDVLRDEESLLAKS